MPHQIVAQVGIKIKTSITGGKESNSLWRICLKQDGKPNELSKYANFVSKFKAKHGIEDQIQFLEESQNCSESNVGEGFRFIDLKFLIEQLEEVAVHVKGSFLTLTAFSSRIGLLKLGVKIIVKSIL